MAEYDFTAGPRKGKVYKEKYYLRNNKNFIQEAKKYIPINSQWLTKEQFKNYVLSLLDKGIPQIYVLEELPEDLFPYALIFVQNEEKTSIYVDKEGIRTEINIGDKEYDAVDITDKVPEEARNNTIYFVNQPESKKKEKNVLECEIYVCDNDELKKIELKGADIPELEQIKQVVNDVISKSLKNVYNTNLTANKVVITDTEGRLRAGNTDPVDLDLHLYWTANGSLKNIYDKTVTADRVMISSSSGYVTTSSITTTTANNIVNGLTTKSLKNFYNATAKTNRMIISDPSGYLVASSMLHTDVSLVVYSVLEDCLKNIFNKKLEANRNIVTDANGYLTTSGDAHLYAQHFHYDKGGRGEVNFVVYTRKSTELNNSELGDYLTALGCTEYYRAYPANGQSQATGGIVNGVYVKPYSGPLFAYTLYVNSYTIGGNLQEQISNYPDTSKVYITQIY